MAYFQSHLDEMDECQLFELKVILNELIINAVRHGNQEEGSKQVKVSAGITEDKCAFLIVEDQGEGHAHKCMPDTSLFTDIDIDACNLKESGRGILIVSSLCDRVRYNHKGNKVIVYKKLCRL